MLGRLVNNKFERLQNNVFMVLFEALSWYLPEGTEENNEKPVMIAGPQAKVWTWDLMCREEEGYPLDHILGRKE